MKQVFRVDANGLYIEDAIIGAAEVTPDDCVDIQPSQGFHWPKWNGITWVEGGAAPAPVVPSVVTMRQARLALLAAGHIPAITAIIAGMSTPQKEQAQIEWEFSQEVSRNYGLVVSLIPALGLTAEQVDQLFITAAGL